MWPNEKMKFSPYVIISILLINLINSSLGLLSDKRLCGDPACLEPVSTGRTLVDYPSGDNDILSFRKNVKVIVYSKSAGSREDLWGVEINGVRGYVPKRFVREDKILKRNLEYTLDIASDAKDSTEINIDINDKSADKTEELVTNPLDINVAADRSSTVDDLKPDQATYEVIGETTIYFSDVDQKSDKSDEDTKESIKPTVSESIETTNIPTQSLPDATIIETQNEEKKEDEKPVSGNESSEVALENTDVKQDIIDNILVNVDNLNKSSTDLNQDVISPKLDIQEEVKTEQITEAPIVMPPILEEIVILNKKDIEINSSEIKIVKRDTRKEDEEIESQEAHNDEQIEQIIIENIVAANNSSAEDEKTSEQAENIDVDERKPEETSTTELPIVSSPEAFEITTPSPIQPEIKMNVEPESKNDMPFINTESTQIPILDNKMANIDYTVKNTVINEIPLNEKIEHKKHDVPILTPEINIASTEFHNSLENNALLKGSNEDISNNLKDSLKLLQQDLYPPFKKFSDDPVLAENIDNINKNIATNKNVDSITTEEKIVEDKVEAVGTVEEIKYQNQNEQIEVESKENDSSNIDQVGIFDWIYELISSKSENVQENQNEVENLDERHDALLSRIPKDKEVCSADSSCQVSDTLMESEKLLSNLFVEELRIHSGSTIMYLTITAATVLIFTLGYYYIEKWRQDGSLLRKVNTLEQALMVSSKECEILRENLEATQTKLTSIKEGAFGSNEEVIALQEEKKKLEMTILDKERQFMDLQKEFEAATETGLELNKMLQDMMMTAQKGDTIAESMEQAQLQLNEQKETINSMSAALATRSKENNTLQIKIKEYENQIDLIQNLLGQEKSTNKLIKEEQLKVQQQLQSLTDQLAKSEEERSYEIQQVRSVLSETQRDLYAKTNQVQLLEECIKKVKSGNNIEVNEFASIAELQTDLHRLTSELESLREHDSQETMSRKNLEENIKALMNEIATVKEEHHKAEKDKMEAQTRLEVLSGYFKEKETQLQKELGIQEALWQQKQGEATSTVERLHSMKDEIQSLKSQNQSLHSEIEQQAAAHRIQVTALESRVHEAWLNSRQTQRKLEESRQEASALRRKLTSLVEQENMQKRGSSPLELQLSATSPIHMNSAVSPILPPPPLPFLPPPFLPPPIGNHAPPPAHFMPPFMGDMRPPPLGRLPSPPRQRRGHYSPSMASERYSPESRAYSPESRAYSPDSRAYSPAYRRPISPYDTETDISPPGSPYRNKYNSYSRRDEPRKLSKGMISAESNETVNRNGKNHTSKAV
uniref:Putative transport and golgi organization protein 1 isoform x3 n=1 Tax=Xenopsylla cheopis TaxID=163159 RepID=A0A6M2DGM8_XENCH